MQRPLHTVRVVCTARSEKLTTVFRHGHGFVAGAFKYKAEKGQDTRPGAVGADQPGRAGAVEEFAQALEAVAAVEDAVVARQKSLAAFREEDDHHAHDNADGGAVDVLRVEFRVARVQRGRVAVDEEFRCLAHAFAEYFGEVGLAFPAVVDAVEQRADFPVGGRCPQPGGQHGPEAGEFIGEAAFRKPLVEFPLGPGIVIETGEHNAPLVAIGDKGKLLIALPKPL